MSKDLQYYLDHPDELPDDPAILAELATQMETPVAADDKTADNETDVKKEEPAPSGDENADPADKQTEEEPTAIATRDGKGTIPYDVLKSERERRQQAEAAVADLSTKLEEIQAQLAKGTAKGEDKAEQIGAEALAAMSPEELEALRADFPVFGKVIDNLMNTISSLSSQVDNLRQSEQSREADTRQAVAQTVQELIDSEPVLAYLQSQNPALFGKAVEIDKTLVGDPRYPDMASRFKKVAEIMDVTFGPFDGVAKAPAKQDKPVVSKEQVRETVTKQTATKAVPKSLSDIPTGEIPESDEMSQLENLSPAEISDRLMKMTSDQRTSFLNRIR